MRSQLCIMHYALCISAATLLMTACSPESFDSPDQSGIPSIQNVDINIDLDQSVNQATFTVANMPKQTYPIWLINGTQYSTLNPAVWSNSKAGTYSVELRLGNYNGFSQGSVSKSFTFDNSQVDYTAYYNRISRTWRINYAVAGHMGCGEPGSDGSNWWSAAPGDKKDWGVYDDRITFDGGSYTYNPGEGGTMYVNTGCSLFAEYNTNDGQDFMVPVDEQTTNFMFDSEGDKIVLRLDGDSYFPYISSDAQFANPVFTVSKLTNSEMVLLYEGDGITWRFVFTSKEDDGGGEGGGDQPVVPAYDFNDPGNMLKDATWELFRYYAHGDAWEGYNVEDMTYTNDGNKKFVVTLPYESNQRWQAQFQLQNLGGVSTSADKTYDFSIKLKASQDLNSATVKFTDAADDTNFYFDEVIPLEGGTEYVLVKSEMPGKDIALMHLVFDFGGCQAGTEVEITDMCFKEHGGGSGDGGGSTSPMNYDDADNLWKAIDENSAFELGYYFAAGDDWHSIEYTEASHNGSAYEITLPAENGKLQWQSQFHIDTKLTASAAKTYDFQFIIETDDDCPQVTMKLTDAGDTNCFVEERNDVPAGTNLCRWENVSLKEGADADAIRFFLDFGGSPGGTTVKVSEIIFREHR